MLVISTKGSSWIVEMGSAMKVLCDCNILLRLSEKFCWTTMVPTQLLSVDCWAIKTYNSKKKVSIIEKHILFFMCGNSKRDKVKNKYILCKVVVTHIEKKISKKITYNDFVRCDVDLNMYQFESELC